MIATDFPEIRKAQIGDARGLHEAHMRSIREICSKDYNARQIAAWGQREFDESLRAAHIRNDYVWVVTLANGIEGYGHMRRIDSATETLAYIHGLYLTSKVSGRGVGRKLMLEMERAALGFGATQVHLDSTITARNFYEACGFRASGEVELTEINGEDIESIPMIKVLV